MMWMWNRVNCYKMQDVCKLTLRLPSNRYNKVETQAEKRRRKESILKKMCKLGFGVENPYERKRKRTRRHRRYRKMRAIKKRQLSNWKEDMMYSLFSMLPFYFDVYILRFYTIINDIHIYWHLNILKVKHYLCYEPVKLCAYMLLKTNITLFFISNS